MAEEEIDRRTLEETDVSRAQESGNDSQAPQAGGVDTGPAVSGVSEQGAAVSPMSEQEAVMGYDQQIEALKAAAAATEQETPEQKRKRERRERARKTIAAFADGAQALANLYYTSQYAPNAYNPQHSQLGKVNERIEALKAERQADADRYNNYMLRLGDAQNARAKTLRDMQAQQEALKQAREKARRDAEAHNWLALRQPDILREQKGKADRAEQEAKSAQAEAEAAPEMQQARLATERARKGSLDASASNSRASAAAHGRSNVSEFQGLGKDGRLRRFRTRQAAIDYERRNGTYDAARWGDDLEEVVRDTATDRITWKRKPVKGKGY